MARLADALAVLFIFISLWWHSSSALPTTASGENYLCNGLCGVTRMRCSCTELCLENNDCCVDYLRSCRVHHNLQHMDTTQWKDDVCATGTEMKCSDRYTTPPLIIFSIDGFLAEYLYREKTPTIWKLATCGVHAPYMRSVYPTKTFPNHYTIVTGLYPESHGIIDNKMFDNDLQLEFKRGSTASQPHWWGGEPIWVTARKQGKKSAAYFWPGSDVNITMYPNYYNTYNKSVSHEERIYQVLDWLDMPESERPELIVSYASVVDHAGHKYGPDSIQVNQALAKADAYVSMLMDGLKMRNLHNCANVIVLADHGMSDISCDRKTSIEDYGVDVDTVYFRDGAIGKVGRSHDPNLADLFDAKSIYNLLKCSHEKSHWQAFLKNQYLPKRFHHANNNRIEEVILAMDDGWISEGRKDTFEDCDGGSHGFDNEFSSMHALFASHGPGFKRKLNTTDPFENIELYNLMADLLKIDAAPNNGTKGSIYHIMSKPHELTSDIAVNLTACGTLEPNAYKQPCTPCPDISIEEANDRLLNSSNDAESRRGNTLYGLPQNSNGNILSCLLIHEDYINEYDQYLRTPLYVTYTLDKTVFYEHPLNECIRPEARLPPDNTYPCIDYNMNKGDGTSYAFLYSPGLSKGMAIYDATVETNLVPMYEPAKEVWNYMTQILSEWSLKYNGINVVAGPVFDYDHDGHRDNMATLKSTGKFITIGATTVPVPTHFFLVISRCVQSGQNTNVTSCVTSPRDVEILSFIIPNYSEIICHKPDQAPSDWIPKTLKEHVARLRDVEILTGLSFLPKWTHAQNVDQETRVEATRLRLRLPQFDSQWMMDFLNYEASK
uniref:venom phosphodiesterase 2-like n=1 Tax=Ciona intestinalis TaxID=7719 RepID=UPI000180BCFC|nr:venom phosphodiesterase 2-like [Ciona intestinalis]|eukprot:XP_002124677.1 venom phosphodiesterase 2-like [Ciona intestinalis]